MTHNSYPNQNMNGLINLLKGLRKGYRIFQKINDWNTRHLLKKYDPYASQLYEKRVQFFNQEANDYVRNVLLTNKPCMISKFGTIELSALTQYKTLYQKKYSLTDYLDFIKERRKSLGWHTGIDKLCTNAGFFPNDIKLLDRYYRINRTAVQNIDILGSYRYEERFFDHELKGVIRINIDGYYAPFYYNDPWTIALKDKKILLIHPFEDTIKKQYKNRKLIWDNPDILPRFDLKTLKAVQTILGQPCEYTDWFEALNAMKTKMSKIDFDVVLIGCGAYGMPLASFAKDMGKQAVHLAGWTQILFGIKGKRWTTMPSVAKYMNTYWVYPSESEIPKGHKKIENGCYW